MTKKLDLYLSQVEFEGLHQVAASRRTKAIVSPQALLNLLMDYSTLLAAVEGSTTFSVIHTNDAKGTQMPADKRPKRPRLGTSQSI